MKNIILGIYDFFCRHRFSFWATFILSFVLLGFLSLRINFEEDISKMLQMNEGMRKYNTIIQNTKLVDKLAVSISFKDSLVSNDSLLISYGDSLYSRLQTIDSTLIRKITYRSEDLPFVQVYGTILRNLPFFLDSADYSRFDTLISPERIKQYLQSSLELLGTPTGMMVKQTLSYDPIGFSTPMLNRLRQLGDATNYDLSEGYFFTKDHKHLVLFVEPASKTSETGKNTKLVNKLRSNIDQLLSQAEFQSLRCQFFGSTAVAVANAKQIQRDTTLTVIVLSLVLILLSVLVFRKKRTAILIFLPVVFGLLFALAIIVFIKPTISLIAIGASSVLLGIAVNYPLHLMTHYLYEKDLKHVISDMVVPMTIGSATTIGGFLCLLFVKSEILNDFGLLGAFSLLGAALFSLIFLPHLVGKAKISSQRNVIEKGLDWFGNFRLESSKLPIIFIVLATPFLFFLCNRVEFDSDLYHLNYMPSELRKAEKELSNSDVRTYPYYVISYGRSVDSALSSAYHLGILSDSLNGVGIRNSYSSIADLVPPIDIQSKKIYQWKKFWNQKRKEQTINALNRAAKELGFKKEAFGTFSKIIETPPSQIDSSDYNYLLSVFGRDVMTSNAEMTTLVSVIKVPVTKADEVEKKITSIPNTTILDKKFIANQLMSNINSDFNFISYGTALLVFIALFLTYGRIELTLIVFIPMVLSWIWILGLMALFGIKFNIVNIILSTFIFGLGDDFCIFIMDGLLQEYRTGKKQLQVIKISILLSGVTTLVGFGVLFLAKHPAIQSIAAVSMIGILSVLFLAQTLEPYLYKLFITKALDKGRAPISVLTILKSVFAFSFFIVGSIALTVIGFLLVVVNPIARARSRKLFNVMISRFSWLQIYIMANVKKTVIYSEPIDYNKPFILISNHQSVIDILLVSMLNPKIIMLTNKWVWKSPVFGYVVRMAGYYPVIEGVDVGIDTLQKKIDEGYSIAIFPEGTRSDDGQIHRFHKGAFYLADTLKLDIVPVMLHGVDRCIQKGSYILRDETISVKVLPRIKYGDATFGTTYQEKTKIISSYFKREFANFKQEIETTHYFKNQLIGNFIYKGPVLEWYMKIKLRLENNYEQFHSIVPSKGTIVDAGCGYGFMSYMLAYTSPDRKIIGVDYDEDKIEVAQKSFGRPSNLKFEVASIVDYKFCNSDCIIFSDVMHYLPEESRIKVFKNAVSMLNPDGTIIVRDGDSEMSRKHMGTKITEFFSTKILRFNKVENRLNFFSAKSLIEQGKHLGLTSQIIDKTKLSSNVIVVFKKNGVQNE